MERTRKIIFGKVDGYGNGRKNCEVITEVCLEDTEKGPEFSTYAIVLNNLHTRSIISGQCYDIILDRFAKDLKANGTFDEFKVLYDLWKKHHLNGMHAGTEEQENAVMERFGNENADHYKEHKNYLKSIDLYEVPMTEYVKLYGPKKEEMPSTYKYGSGWVHRPIPEKDLEAINLILEKGMEGLKELVLKEKNHDIPEEELEIE